MSISMNAAQAQESFSTSFEVKQSPKDVFNAIINVRGWWSEEVQGSTSKPNDEFLYHFKDVHLCKIKVLEAIPEKKVVWYVIDNRFSFVKDTSEWKGTTVIFDIEKKDNKTVLRFTHEGLVKDYECFEVCKEGWSNYINGSLQALIVTGKGKPNPKEGGFNQALLEKWQSK